MGEGGELERGLDDVIGTDSTLRLCCEMLFEKKKLCKRRLNQVVEKSFDFVLPVSAPVLHRTCK